MAVRSSNITKTVAVAMIVGGAISATAAVMAKPKKKKMIKQARKTLDTITSAAMNIAGYMK